MPQMTQIAADWTHSTEPRVKATVETVFILHFSPDGRRATFVTWDGVIHADDIRALRVLNWAADDRTFGQQVPPKDVREARAS